MVAENSDRLLLETRLYGLRNVTTISLDSIILQA